MPVKINPSPTREQLGEAFAISFVQSVDRRGPEDCWPWVAGRDGKGYGAVMVNGVNCRAHRVAYIVANGSIPDGLHVLHHCDNPACCNPSHLYAGTAKQNADDRTHRERMPVRHGATNEQAKLSAEQVREVFRLRAAGVTIDVLSLQFKLSSPCIRRILSRKSYRDVEVSTA